MSDKPFIPEDITRQTYEQVMAPLLLRRLSLFGSVPQPKPRPWYRRLWTRIDRWLPRVTFGPRDGYD